MDTDSIATIAVFAKCIIFFVNVFYLIYLYWHVLGNVYSQNSSVVIKANTCCSDYRSFTWWALGCFAWRH